MAHHNQSGMRNMTTGSIGGHLFCFSLPLLVGNFLQQLYNMVDSWVVGNYVSDAALAAVGTGFPVIFMFSSLFMGLSTGGTVVISQFYGAGQDDRVRDAVDTIYAVFIRSAIPLSLLAVLLVRPMLMLMRVDDAAYRETWIYLTVVCAGLVGTIGYNLNSGILNGLGNSRTTLLFLATAAILNITLDLLFVLVFHWGVFGVAFATILAQAFSWLFGLFYINRNYPQIAIHPFKGRIDWALFRRVIGIGLPAGVQMSLVSIGTIFVLSKINTFGKSFTAGFNVGNKLDSLAFLPTQAMAASITAFVGQNIGAGREDRARQGIRITAMAAALWTVLTAAVLCLWGDRLAGLFSPDAPVIQAAATYLGCIMPPYILFSTLFIINAGMRGAGDSVFPMFSVVVSLILVRVPVLYLLANRFGSDYMFWSYGVGWVVGFCMSFLYYRSGRWKRRGSLAKQPPGGSGSS